MTSLKDHVLEDLEDVIETFEGGFQAQPQDVGNWVNGALIGTMRGVTPAALARHRHIPVRTVTRAMMQSVTLHEAAEIGYLHYYLAPGFDKLPYNEFTWAYVDAGWGSGPYTAIKEMQRLVGTGADGIIGPATQRAFDKYLEAHGLANAMRAYVTQRVAFFERVVAIRPSNGIYLRGWKRRAYAMLPENLGMPIDWQGYPEDLWEPGEPVEYCGKSWVEEQ